MDKGNIHSMQPPMHRCIRFYNENVHTIIGYPHEPYTISSICSGQDGTEIEHCLFGLHVASQVEISISGRDGVLKDS